MTPALKWQYCAGIDSRVYSVDLSSLEEKLQFIVLLYRRCRSEGFVFEPDKSSPPHDRAVIRDSLAGLMETRHLTDYFYNFDSRFRDEDVISHNDLTKFMIELDERQYYSF